LVDAQVAHGWKIADKIEASKKFAERSIDSLRHSLQDLKSQPLNGAARKPSGEKVDDPRTTDETEDREQTETVNKAQFANIISHYHELYYGPQGPFRAKQYLQDARAKGLIPANVQP
jgi:hypothetical protein